MKRSFRDPNTGVLKAHGYMASNEPGDIAQEEADDFDLTPWHWRWDGSGWVAMEDLPAGPPMVIWP